MRPRSSGFGVVSREERAQADRFFADLYGARGRQAEGAGEQESTNDELKRRRLDLLGRIRHTDVHWHDIPLAGGFRIRVSSPILKDNLFVPATWPESLALARQFGVFPLTRAVMDQAHNAAIKVDKQATPASLFDFVAYSNSLRSTPYHRSYGYALASGAHKLWVISSRGANINYGFYIPRRRGELVRCGRYLDPQYNVTQGLGGWHKTPHWDYSQLLQFMTRLTDSSGQSVDLRQALLNQHPAVWDEPAAPATDNVP